MVSYVLRMQITTRAAGFVLVIAATLALAGCAQSSPRVIPTAEPSFAPVFTSDADALAAAKKAYAGYLAASDAVAHDGGVGVDRLATWDSPSQFKQDQKSFSVMKSEGHHTTGTSTFFDTHFQSSVLTKSGSAVVVAYLCVDVSNTTLLDSKEHNVGKQRQMVVPLQVTFASTQSSSATLSIERSVPWTGTDFCF